MWPHPGPVPSHTAQLDGQRCWTHGVSHVSQVAGQATAVATAGEPAEQADTKGAETTALGRRSEQGRAGKQQWQQQVSQQSRQQQWQQQASQQSKQGPQVRRPPCLCAKVCNAGQATTMATTSEPA